MTFLQKGSAPAAQGLFFFLACLAGTIMKGDAFYENYYIS